jgi:hypothetical protein
MLGTQKKGGPADAGPPLPPRLEAGDVRCLQALRPAGHFEFNRLAFVQRLVPLSLNGREVHEDIFAGLALDEPVPFAGIEPLHCSLFSHLVTHFAFVSYLRFSTASSRKTKKAASVNLQPLPSNLKVLQEQQTQAHYITIPGLTHIFSFEKAAQTGFRVARGRLRYN